MSYFPYKITNYSDGSSDLDFVILCPHGDVGDDFLRAFPDFEKITYLNPSDLRNLCRAEADFGTSELSHKTAKLLSEKGYSVAVFESLLPREIIDCNRIEASAIQPVFDLKKRPEVYDLCKRLYREMDEAQIALLERLKPSGRFLDIHTMRHFELPLPTPLPEESTEEKMVAHYQNKLDALKKGQSIGTRVTCLITQNIDEHPDTLMVDANLLKSMRLELKNQQLSFTENDPYPSHSNHAFYHLCKRFGPRGLAIDFLKDLLSKEGRDDPNFDLASLTLDETKVDRLVEMMVKGVDGVLSD